MGTRASNPIALVIIRHTAGFNRTYVTVYRQDDTKHEYPKQIGGRYPTAATLSRLRALLWRQTSSLIPRNRRATVSTFFYPEGITVSYTMGVAERDGDD